MRVLLDIKDEKAEFVMELLRNFKFVKTKTLTESEAEFYEGLKEAVEEVNLAKAGKIKLKPIDDLINEL